jgi:hypothetical protein
MDIGHFHDLGPIIQGFELQTIVFALFCRMKREMDNGIIARGVEEMNKLIECYNKKKLDIERQHQLVNDGFAAEKAMVSSRAKG